MPGADRKTKRALGRAEDDQSSWYLIPLGPRRASLARADSLTRYEEGPPIRVLITGGGGFIGSHVVDRCLSEGHEVRVLDNFATGRRENLVHVAKDVELIEGDIQSYERVHRAIKGCEVVLHQAALPSVPRSIEDPLASNASNVTGTLNVLSAARDNEVRRVVYASSSSVYGQNPALPKREDLAEAPFSPYAVAKHAGKGYCRSFHHVYGLDTISLRYFNVFGPRQDPLSQYAAVIPNFIAAVLGGQRPTIYGNGEQSRDFTHVDNVVEANILSLSAQGVGGRLYNIAAGERISLNRLIEELKTVTGREIAPEYTSPRAGDVLHSQADIQRARDELGYRPVVTFREGLAVTLEHYAGRVSAAVG